MEETTKIKKGVRLVHYYAYFCPKCQKETRFKFATNWSEFIQSMVELGQQEYEESHAHKSLGGISDEEFESIKQILNTTEFYEDFLVKIGVQLEDYLDEKDENK